MTEKISIGEKQFKNLLHLIIPMMISFIFNNLYNIVDSLWIGNLLGKQAMAALTISSPFIVAFTSVFIGACEGVSVMLSYYVGAGDEVNSKKVITVSFITCMFFCFLLILLSHMNIDNILIFMNTPDELYHMAKQYLSAYIWGLLFVFMFFYLTAILRSYGNTMIQMGAIIFCTILNAVLDPIFINIWGFQGAAIATIFSQFFAAIILFIFATKKGILLFNIHFFDVKVISLLIEKQIYSIVQQIIPVISTVYITLLVSSFSIDEIAGFGIASKMELILLFPSMAINLAITTITGQCYGAKKIHLIVEYLILSIKIGLFITLPFLIIILLFPSVIANMFVTSYSIAKIVSTYFYIIGIGYLFNCITNCIMGVINGMGRLKIGMVIMIISYIVFRLSLAKYFSGTILELKGIWISILISYILSFVLTYLYYCILIKKQNRNIDYANIKK